MKDAVGRDFMRRYKTCFEEFLGAGDALTEEESLYAVNELGREMLAAGYAKDDLLRMHAQVQRLAVARFAEATDTRQRTMYRRMAGGNLRAITHELLIAHDFSERASQAMRWRVENLKHQSVLDALEASIVMLDSEGRITNFNRVWRQFGVENGNPGLRGCGIGDNYLAAYGTVPDLLERMQRVLSGGESFEARYECEGSECGRWFILRAAPLPIAEGGALVMHMDVTNQVLADRRLRAADKLSAITTQAAGVAHDFNNLLGAIVGQTDLCLALAEPESRLAANLGKIKRAAQKASQLVRSMLDFSSQKPLNAVSMPIDSFVDRCRSLLTSVLPECIDLSLRCELLDEVKVEMESLEQVILNLASNAAYAMREAGGELSIWVDKVPPRTGVIDAPQVDGVQYLRIVVRDNGTGIPPEVMDSIFDPFFTTKPIGEGTGLGLAAAQGIVRAHGGGVDVESTLGEGTLFYVHIPIVVAESSDPTSQPVSLIE